jgi:hypothetical protein
MIRQTANNFTRYTEFQEKLQTIREHYEGVIVHHNGAVIVRGNGDRQSIGVTRVLTNYYKPSDEELTKINNAEDQGRERNFAAFKTSIDRETFNNKFHTVVDEEKFEHYDHSMTVDDKLFENHDLIPIGPAEYTLGTPSLVVREHPRADAAVKYIVGSIDRLRYNKRTAKLVLLELKSGQTRAAYMAMRTLYLKEKHCKQLTFYAFILQVMALEAGVKITQEDIELIVVGVDTSKRTVSVWQMQYDPKTFLGGVWAGERWCGIVDTGMLMRLTLDEFCCIPDCTHKAVFKVAHRPELRYCSQACRSKPHCDCGRPASYRSPTLGKYLCKDCA